ncbi:MAG: initiation control protein YabA [Clostridiales bacterium]|jgi:regulator of replication initiation timing|nr:initiation control protein YabA [Clostridiales bacterium]MDR2712620.1 initiation control protein YabA [Clostridiales bacterium]
MSLGEELLQLEEKLAALYEECERLRQAAASLEEKKNLLSQQLAAEQELKPLNRIYDEGFHICHAYFTKERAGECLFCLALLKGSAAARE